MIYSYDGDGLEVTQVKIKPELEKKYVGSLCDKIVKDLSDREPLEKSWKTAVCQYNSSLESQQEGSHYRESEDSQLDVPSTRQYIEMAISRFMNPIFQRDTVYMAKPKEPQYYEVAAAFESFADWMVDRAKFRLFVEQFLKQAFIYTKGVVKIPFRTHKKKVKQYYHEVDKGDGTIEEQWGAKGDKPLVKYYDGYSHSDANPEVIPCADFIHPMPISDIKTAPRVTHRIWKTKDEIRKCIAEETYREYEFGAKSGRKIIDLIGDPSRKPDADLSLSIHSTSNDDDSFDCEDGELYEIFECYTTYKGDEVIVTIDRESKTCLRFPHNFYMEDERPFLVWSYETILNDIDGSSLCYILEPYHRALSGILNQRLDAASRAMSQIMLFSVQLGLDKYVKEGKLPAGAYQVNSVGDLRQQVEQYQMSQPFTQIEGLEASIKMDMSKLASLTDYNAGVEQIERPTATGQVALLEEGKQPQYARMESFREFLTDVGMMMISRYRQFHPVDLKYYMESKNPEEQQMIAEVITWPTEYWREQVIIEPTVTSQTMNKDLRKQEILAMVDKIPQIGEQIMGIAQVAMEPGPMSAIAKKFLDFEINAILKPFMKEFEIDADEFLNLGEEINIGEQFNQAIQQLQGQVEQLQAENEGTSGTLNEVIRVLENTVRQFVAATGKVPVPPPTGKSQETGPPTPPEGMGGSAPVPGPAGAQPMG